MHSRVLDEYSGVGAFECGKYVCDDIKAESAAIHVKASSFIFGTSVVLRVFLPSTEARVVSTSANELF
jgi:hypothetical protein